MPLIKKILIAILIVVAFFYIIGYFYPAKWSVKRSVKINKSAEEIFPYLNDLHKWSEWYPWTREMDITMTVTYDGPQSGIGAIRKWTGNSVKNGEIEIIKNEKNSGVWYTFKSDQTKIVVNGSIRIQSEGEMCEVTWEDTGDSGFSFLTRFMAGGIDEAIGRYFESGLQNLKTAVEQSAR